MTILFTCANKECMQCSKKNLGLVTGIPEDAAKHSEDNSVQMWISNHSTSEADDIMKNYWDVINS